MPTATPPDESARPEIVPLVEEELRVDKRETVTGKVRVGTRTDTVEELAQAELTSDTVDVTRVPVGRMIDKAPEIRTEGDTVIIPVVEEILVVEKRLVLKEELHVRRRVETETVAVPVTLRRQRAVIERERTDDAEPAKE